MYKEVLKLCVSVALASLVSYVKMAFVASNKEQTSCSPQSKPK